MSGLLRCLARGSVLCGHIGGSSRAYSALRQRWPTGTLPLCRLSLGSQQETWVWIGMRANCSNSALEQEAKVKLEEIVQRKSGVRAFESVMQRAEGGEGRGEGDTNGKDISSMLKDTVESLCEQERAVEAAELLLLHNSRAEASHAVVVRLGEYESMINAYLKEERGIEAGRVLREMAMRGVSPAASLTGAVIRSHCSNEDFLSAVATVKDLESAGVRVKSSVVDTALIGLIKAYFSAGKKEVEEMIAKRGSVSDEVMSGLVVGWCGKGDTAAAAQVVSDLLKRGSQPSHKAVTELVQAYCSEAKVEEARALLDSTPERVTPSALAALVKAYCMKDQLDAARQLVLDAVETGVNFPESTLWRMIESIAIHKSGGAVAEGLHRELLKKEVPGAEALLGRCVDTLLKAGHHNRAGKMMAIMHEKDMLVPMGPYVHLSGTYLAQAAYDKLAVLLDSLTRMRRVTGPILQLVGEQSSSFNESKAWRAVKASLATKDSPTEELCTIILASIRARDGPQKATAAFERMMNLGIKPGRFMLYQVLRAHAISGHVTLAEQTAAMLSALPLVEMDNGYTKEVEEDKAKRETAMLERHREDVKKLNIVRPFALSGEELGDEHWQPVALEGGMENIGGIKISFEENLSLDEYNELLYAHFRSGNTEGAERVLTRLCDAGYLPNLRTWKILANAHVSCGSTEVGESLLGLLESVQTSGNGVSAVVLPLRQQLIQAYSLMGQTDKAMVVARKLASLGQHASPHTTDTLVNAFLSTADISGSLVALREAITAGSRPRDVVYMNILKEWRARRLGWRPDLEKGGAGEGRKAPSSDDTDPEVVLEVCKLANRFLKKRVAVLCRGFRCLGLTDNYQALDKLVAAIFSPSSRVSAELCEAVLEALNGSPPEQLTAFWKGISLKRKPMVELTPGVFACAAIAFLRQANVAAAVEVLKCANTRTSLGPQELYTISTTVANRSSFLEGQATDLRVLREVIEEIAARNTRTLSATEWPLAFEKWPEHQ